MSIPNNSILKSRYTRNKQLWLLDIEPVCESCGIGTRAIDCSHVISRNDCLKHGLHVMPNGKPLYTLYYDQINFRAHCNDFSAGCHRKYEDGTFIGADYELNRAFIYEVAPTELYVKFIQRFEARLN